ncbi:putative LRR receptor-like serine/threonine-protein kinase EFR-like [Capsicum annuum]|nr:putative LRR receptor-like serine/threonine-protein kinase EFR-like [Capsicum annuum]
MELWMESNQMTGSVPISIFNISVLKVLSLARNNLNGFLSHKIGILTKMQFLYHTQNRFTGSLPNCLGNITSLREIHLGSNKLSSNIPPSLGYLQDLVVLDLSSTHGIIPMSLEKLQNLKYFNVFVNKLYGEIPSGGPFKNLSSQFFVYNEALCGSSRFSVPPCPTSSKHRERISYYELIQATDVLSESNLIGSESFGSVYKGVLKSGTTAVKVFNMQVDEAFKILDTECEVLRNLRHRNLGKVITSCSNLDFKALVLEYMPNGRHDKYLYLHYFLDIKQRLSIMIDVAYALEYLHSGCSSPVIHCDLNPKYGRDGMVSIKCDVYSYGILLLETFTRRKPNEFEGDLGLKQWMSYSLQEAVMDVVDANLLTSRGNCLQKDLHVVASIMKVALDCCVESPAGRTNMKDVVGTLQKIKIQLLSC